ncbi:hypothetical protein [Bradyrhizobium sp. CCBAU 11361]|nr:hypothetical protein [Bradyrhizobium sp. CCBAU 11361]
MARHAGTQKVLIGEDVPERLGAGEYPCDRQRGPKYAFKDADGVI